MFLFEALDSLTFSGRPAHSEGLQNDWPFVALVLLLRLAVCFCSAILLLQCVVFSAWSELPDGASVFVSVSASFFCWLLKNDNVLSFEFLMSTVCLSFNIFGVVGFEVRG